MKEDIILVGGGGHCKSCIDVIEQQGKYQIKGIVDVPERRHEKILGYEVLATDDDLPRLAEEYGNFVILLGQVKNPDRRIRLFETLKDLGARFPVIISPLAYVSKDALVDNGSVIMHKAFVDTNVSIGENCIINTGAIIEHDTRIGDHCHISTGAVINGRCRIEGGTFVGSNSVIGNDICVAGSTVIGAGSVVVRSIEQGGTYVGNPAKRVRNG